MKNALPVALLLAVIGVGGVAADTFNAQAGVSLNLTPQGVFRLNIKGRPWQGTPPTFQSFRVTPGTFGQASLIFETINDLARLSPHTGPGSQQWVQGLDHSKQEQKEIDWITSGPAGGCLIITDTRQGYWDGPNTFILDPANEPILASAWLTPDGLKVLRDTVYHAMDIKRDMPRHQSAIETRPSAACPPALERCLTVAP